MENPRWLLYWRIATTQGGLTKGNFFARGLPPPDLPDFSPYTQLVPQSQGGLSEQGYQNITLLWNQMTYLQIKVLNDLIDGATNSILYATIDRAHGQKLLNDFVDCQCIVQPLQFDYISQSRGTVFSNVRLVLTNIVILVDPSPVVS
jgi:hypothetical protein